MFGAYVIKSFFLVMLFSGVPLLVTSISGLLVSVLQAATQVQEQSVAYLVKFISLSIALAVLASFFSNHLVGLFQEFLGSLEYFGRGKW